MPRVQISAKAAEDIDRIVAYTINEWGWRQADLYLAKLEDGFDILAGNPSIGRQCNSIRAGLRRFEIGRHVVFYLIEPDGVMIARVLHDRMLPNTYL